MTILWHATPRHNAESIAERGLLCSLARGRILAVWLHTRGMTPQIRLHTALRHQCDVLDVIVIGVRVGRASLRRRRRGVWYTTADVRPEWLILPFDLDAQTKLYAECPW